MIDEILQKIENLIEPDFVLENERAIKSALNFERTDKPLVTVFWGESEYKAFPPDETFYDMEKMLFNELINVYMSCRDRRRTVYTIRANYGVGSLPSYFGITSNVVDNSLPWVNHAKDLDEVRRIVDRGVPDHNDGFGKRIIETYEYYKEKLSKYPKCSEFIKLYHPDFQGVLDTAHLITGSEIYYAMYDDPQLVHDLLQLVTDSYIKLMKGLFPYLSACDEGYLYQWGALFKGGVMLRGDTLVTISDEQYKEFSLPYDEQIAAAFGGASMHYCGAYSQWIETMLKMKGLGSINYGRVPNLIYGKEHMDKVYAKQKANGVAFVNYSTKFDELEPMLDNGYSDGIIFHIWAENEGQAKELIEKYCM